MLRTTVRFIFTLAVLTAFFWLLAGLQAMHPVAITLAFTFAIAVAAGFSIRWARQAR